MSFFDLRPLGEWIMSAPFPGALRVRFQRLINERYSGGTAAAQLQLSPSTGSKLRAHLGRIGARIFSDLFNALAQICDLFKPSVFLLGPSGPQRE